MGYEHTKESSGVHKTGDQKKKNQVLVLDFTTKTDLI
jgi:hypothetical protein